MRKVKTAFLGMRTSLHLSSAYGSNYRAYQTVVAPRLYSIYISLDGVALAVYRDRLEIENQVIIPRDADDQFRRGSTRYGQLAVPAPDVLIDYSRINPIVLSFDVNGLRGPHTDHRSRDKFGVASVLGVPVTVRVSHPIAVSVSVSIPISILGESSRGTKQGGKGQTSDQKSQFSHIFDSWVGDCMQATTGRLRT